MATDLELAAEGTHRVLTYVHLHAIQMAIKFLISAEHAHNLQTHENV